MFIRGTAIALLAIIGTVGSSAHRVWADENQEAPPGDEQEEQDEPGEQVATLSRGRGRLLPPLDTSLGTRGDPIPVTRSPSTVTVIDGADLRRSGARFLSDALRLVPGLEVIRTTSTESNVNARGYNDVSSTAQGMMALIDGRQVYNEFFGNVLWDFLPVTVDEIDKIEVIRGPGSFLYGPNAMHGLVNIITKSPLDYDKDVVILSGGYGSYESSVGSLTYVQREGDAGFKATLGWDDIRQFEESLPDKNVGDKKFLELRFERRLGQDHAIELTGGIIQQKQELSIPSTLGVPADDLSNELQESFIKANYTFDPGGAGVKGGELKAQVYWTGFDASSVPDQFYTPFEVDLDTVDTDLQFAFDPWDDHIVTLGTGYRHATFKTQDQDVANGRHSTDQVWAFVQDEIVLANDLFVTAGVRVDWHSVSGVNVSPRIAGVWRFDEVKDDDGTILGEQSLRASVGFGFRNPSLRELWFNMPVPPAMVSILGNTDLEAEKIRSFELGYYGSLPIGDDDRVRAGVNLYYNLIDDLIVFRPVTASEAAPFNQSDEEAYGVEVEVEYLFSPWASAFANYSYSVRKDRDTNERIRTAPENKANAGIRFSTPEGLSATLWANYFDETEFGGTAADDYALVNGQISYAFLVDQTEASVYLRAFNLLDNDQREHPEGQSYGLLLMAGFTLTW